MFRIFSFTLKNIYDYIIRELIEKMKKPKILLIHGWNYINYTSCGSSDAWADRKKFTDFLADYFYLVKINLPGFGGEPDPQNPWDIDQYALYLDGIIQREKPDYVLGYSFGGAVLLRWKKNTENRDVRTILVSPAIIRRYEKNNLSLLEKLLKSVLPRFFSSFLRDLYLTIWRKNPYYTNATKVMRETYLNIVSVDLRGDLLAIEDSTVLIFGEMDTATPVSLIEEALKKARVRHSLSVINGGGHDIANTHTNVLVSTILRELGVGSGV